MPAPSFDSVTFERDGAVVLLTLNEPRTRNAISPGVVDALVAYCDHINADTTIGCVVLTGAGESFSSGGNVKEMAEGKGLFGGAPVDARRAYQHGIQRIPLALYNLETPIIAAVNGHAVGAGCDLAMMCDLRLASEKAEFAESFMRVGLVSGDGGAWFLPRVVGLARAYEMTFTCDFVSARQALEWGMVSRVAPPDDLVPQAWSLARRIAAHPPHAIRLNKKLVRDSGQMALGVHLEMASAFQALTQSTADQKEAVAAFLQKRPPSFTGR